MDGALRIPIERRGIRRYACSGCGRRTSRVRDMKERTWQQLIGVDCQSMPTSHAAVRHGVSWGAARRAEYAFLRRWDQHRPKRRPRYIGLDEIQRGKGHQFWTVLSDIVHGEVIGLRQDRTEVTATTRLHEALTPQHRGRIRAVCTGMWKPYFNAVATVLTKADVVFTSLTCSSTPAPRSMTCADGPLSPGLAEGPPPATTPRGERLGAFLVKHLDGIAAYCFHPVRFGVVESLNTSIKAVIRRARGMRDEAMLLLKRKWAPAHPIRSARDLKRFLQHYELHSNR